MRTPEQTIRTYLDSPTAVGQYIALPALQLMGSPDLFKNFLARFQTQMIRVVQAEPASRLSQLRGRQSFQRRLRRDGHENW